MTYRERREARAERLRGWAEKRYASVAVVQAEADKYRGDHAFNTQPGYIPERARLNRAQERSWESQKKADRMSERADNIEAVAERAIYSDDPDAIDALKARIGTLEAERDRIKAYNATCKKGTRDVTILDAAQQATLVSVAQYSAYQLGKHGELPSYALSNLSGNIARNRERLARLEGTYVQPGMVKCAACGHVKIIHGPKARPGCDECGRCAGFVAAV